ncbi:MAG: hypothetical protein EBZ59_08215 [Planctomycetia bacterium]|nr:hypothetical protein [Planctomycetia bacterium]
MAAITLALAAYLIGLVLSIAGNSGSGGSALVRTVKSRLFSPWLVPAWLDLGFDYRLTYGQPDDADHLVEVRRTDGDGATLLPPAAGGGERAARWRRLARAVATSVDDPDRDGLLAAAIGRGTFDELGSEDVGLRVLRQPLPERSGPASPAEPEEVYAARVRVVGGEVQLIKVEARGDVAPLVPRERPHP